jgi:iron complex transport system substrate-binding protein
MSEESDCARRIVCLTEEPAEILCELGCEDRIVGVSAYAVRPAGIGERKPVVTAFTGGSVEKILELQPDLCIGFSDVQADLAGKLIRAGLAVLVFNQRSLAEILSVVLAVGRLVGRPEAARELVAGYRRRLDAMAAAAPERRPRVYFEEWDEPAICGSRWVSELVEIAGGRDVFADRARAARAEGRRVEWEEVRRADPEVVLCSWCGKPFDRESFLARPGARELTAVRSGRVQEIDPAIILQPGPAALTDGLDALCRALRS